MFIKKLTRWNVFEKIFANDTNTRKVIDTQEYSTSNSKSVMATEMFTDTTQTRSTSNLELDMSETNLYSVQHNPNRLANITALEIRQYTGIVMCMSIVDLPNSRSYWSYDLGFDNIIQTIAINKFEKIRYTIRPVIEHLNERFSSIPLEKSLSVDVEQICSKARHFMEQYMPNKPHKWGFKLFVLGGVSGFFYTFELHAGQENDPSKRLQNKPDLGAYSNVVVRLSRVIQRNQNYRLFFDNYYTS
ncbi:hypothetical protein ILUMI_16040, partial [Ignelater luminosus]